MLKNSIKTVDKSCVVNADNFSQGTYPDNLVYGKYTIRSFSCEFFGFYNNQLVVASATFGIILVVSTIWLAYRAWTISRTDEDQEIKKIFDGLE